MYRHLILVSITFLWPLSPGLAMTTPGIAAPEKIIAPLNQSLTESALNLTHKGFLFNETLTHQQNYISYRVPNSLATLMFHSLGSPIPTNELLQCIAFAVSATHAFIMQGRGLDPISTGFFQFTHEYLNDDEVEIVVADFREIGRAMTYFELLDVVRGIGEFMIRPGQESQELSFEAEFEGRGYLGTGHVGFKPSPTSTS